MSPRSSRGRFLRSPLTPTRSRRHLPTRFTCSSWSTLLRGRRWPRSKTRRRPKEHLSAVACRSCRPPRPADDFSSSQNVPPAEGTLLWQDRLFVILARNVDDVLNCFGLPRELRAPTCHRNVALG